MEIRKNEPEAGPDINNDDSIEQFYFTKYCFVSSGSSDYDENLLGKWQDLEEGEKLHR